MRRLLDAALQQRQHHRQLAIARLAHGRAELLERQHLAVRIAIVRSIRSVLSQTVAARRTVLLQQRRLACLSTRLLVLRRGLRVDALLARVVAEQVLFGDPFRNRLGPRFRIPFAAGFFVVADVPEPEVAAARALRLHGQKASQRTFLAESIRFRDIW